MSEMDFVAVSSEPDPAAEFLAREQNALGDLDDDFTFPNDNSQPVDTSDCLNNSENPIKLNGEVSGESNDGQSNGDIVNGGLSNGISDLSLNSKASEQAPLPGFSQPIIPAEEPESIKKWREEHIKALEEKDSLEQKKIVELKDEGKKELDEWYARYAEQLKAAKQQNREASKNAEKEFVAERDNDTTPGQEWEKINRLCDFNPKTSHNNRDTSRMRSILLQLKQSPPASSSSSSTVAS